MTCWLCGFETTELTTTKCKNGSCQFCVAVATIDEEINQVVATLQCLIAKRNDLRSEQNRAHDPVHRLPDELKNHIFEFLLPLQDEWGEIPRNERTVMPTYLTSICRGWRDIAWSNPFLWSRMHIVLGRSTSDQSKFVHDWIMRSRTLPLTFHIEQVLDRSDGGLERSKNALGPVLDVMSHCSNRLQSLSIDVPFATLCALQHSNIQWHRLMRLRIVMFPPPHGQIYQPLSFLNPTATPEKIEVGHLSPKSLQISWNRLSSATVSFWGLEDIAQLFQHASQMTNCRIVYATYDSRSFSMPPIIHPRLKTLSLHSADDGDTAPALLGSLTLPCLQDFDTDEMMSLMDLPALVHRSSCPLTTLTLLHDPEADSVVLDGLQPLPGVTDLVVESLEQGCQVAMIKKLLLEEYFPDLRHLTLRLEPFLLLWAKGDIPLYLDRKRPRSDGPNKGRLHKFLVIDKDQTSNFEEMWNSDVGDELKALNVTLREDGFEFL